MQMIKINAKVKSETLNDLKQECEKQGRTESGMIRKILEDYFKHPNAYIPGRGDIIYGPDKKDGLNPHELVVPLEKLKNMLASGDSDTQQYDVSEFYKNMPEETIKSNSNIK